MGDIPAGWRWKFIDDDDTKWVVQKRYPKAMAQWPDVEVEPLFSKEK